MNPNEKPPFDADLHALLAPPTPSPRLSTDTHVQAHPNNSGAVSPPPPAYSALPYRDEEFDFAPILNGKIGDVELETTDGKRFLVHRKILESETVFFHIYYGFVPAWRLNASAADCANLPPNPHLPNPPQLPTTAAGSASTAPNSLSTGLDTLLCLPKILVNLRNSPPALTASPAAALEPSDSQPLFPSAIPSRAPTPPPKEVSAPTPTTSPYTWSVPEHSSVLLAFLSLIYPPHFLTPSRNTLLTSLEMTGKVIRASMGYQSSKALAFARDRLGEWVRERPVDVYAMASFFKFADLAILASQYAMKIDRNDWGQEAVKMMGRTAAARLVELQERRVAGLKEILDKALQEDDHSIDCGMNQMMSQAWSERCKAIQQEVSAATDLVDLLNTDFSALQASQGHQTCGQCLVLFGKSVRRSVLAAQALPTNI